MLMVSDDFEGERLRWDGAEDGVADRPTRPSRPRLSMSPLRMMPRPTSPFCFVPAALERAVLAARPHAGVAALIVSSGSPSVVAMAREEDVSRLTVGLLLEAAASVPRGVRGAEVRVAAYADADTAIVEVTIHLGATDAWLRAAHLAAFAHERLGPAAWRDLAAHLGLHLEIQVDGETPCLRLHLPLAAR